VALLWWNRRSGGINMVESSLPDSTDFGGIALFLLRWNYLLRFRRNNFIGGIISRRWDRPCGITCQSLAKNLQ
jgi:hypothetical protein